MAKTIGIQLNDDYDLDIEIVKDSSGKITSGLVIGEITQQNMKMILVGNPGEFKEKPLVGVGINNMILDHNTLAYEHSIREQLTNEGMTLSTLSLSETEIQIDASYD